MKNLKSLLFITLLTLSTGAYGQLNITSPISITNGDTGFGKRSPKLTQGPNGEVIAFWSRVCAASELYISEKTSEGFAQPVMLNTSFNGLIPNLYSGSLGPNVASGNGHMYVTFEVYGDAIYLTHSDDGGQTWDEPIEAFVPPQGRFATIPTIAVNPEGHPYIVYVNTNSQEADAHYGLVRSSDYGASFESEIIVNDTQADAEVCECCNGHIEVAENGDVYIAYRNNTNNLRDIRLAVSYDEGSSFQDYFDLDDTDWMTGVCPTNGPHFTLNENELVSSYFSGTGYDGSGAYYSSFDLNEGTVTAAESLSLFSEASSSQNRARIAGDGEQYLIVWQEYIGGFFEIIAQYSSSGIEGLSEASPFILAQIQNSQNLPSVLFDGEKFHVVFEDSSTGTVMYQEISASNPNSLDELDQARTSLSIFPNPVLDGTLTVKSDSPVLGVMIYDGKGKEVYKHQQNEISGQISFDISSLPSGRYAVSVLHEGYFSVESFIKAN